MTSLLDSHQLTGLPLASVVEGVHELLDAASPVESLSRGEYERLVRESARARARLQSLELKVLAAADRAGVAAAAGAASTAAWHATATNTETAESARQTKLATALDGERLDGTSTALSQGEVSQAHAAVIADAISHLPAGLSPVAVAAVEGALLDKARRMDPKQLRRAARRALEVVERDRRKVDAEEDRRLRDEEAAARARTRFTMHDNGDGTVTVRGVVPTLAGAILKKILDQLASPRRAGLGATVAQAGERATSNPVAEDFDWARRRGEAFCTLLERLPTDHLHGKVAASVIVKTDLEALREGLRAAGLDTGDVISAAEARRLACNAGLVPAVLGGAKQPLDLGRTQRFFTEAQRVAGALRHETCAADGCETPYAWSELHHRQPWSHGGRTDLTDMIPLCGFHHQRIHDPAYHHQEQPDGSITFAART